MIGFFSACAGQKNPQKEANLILQNLREKEANEERIARKEIAKESEKTLKKEIKIFSKKFGLSDLQTQSFRGDELEIRILRLAAFNDKHITFQLKRIDNKWSANLFEVTIAEKNRHKKNPPEKLSQDNLTEPKSGWENLFQKLVNEEIMTLPIGEEVENEACLDCWVYIVETKSKDKYRVYDYHAPEYDTETHESQQLVKILQIISEEFNLDVFDSDNFQQP